MPLWYRGRILNLPNPLSLFFPSHSYAWAAIVYLVCAKLSDKKDMRLWLILPTACVTVVGYVLLVAVQSSTGVSLFACLYAPFVLLYAVLSSY